MLDIATTDWTTVSSLATGAGTLVLAVATFASVRSSNRAARIAEAALQEQRRPVLSHSRLDDPIQKTMFIERHWVRAAGGRAAVEHVDGVIYLAISVRNVGSGIAVCQGWTAMVGVQSSRTAHAALDDFHLQSRDLYVPAGDIGMWQGALRNPADPRREEIGEAIDAGEPVTVELLYTDQVGRQRTISRFGLIPAGDTWLAMTNRHWYLDWDGPRPESLATQASEAILRDQEAIAEERAAAGSEIASAAEADVPSGAQPDVAFETAMTPGESRQPKPPAT